MRKSNIDMCNGPLLNKIILYTIPIIFTGILQLLFNAADLVIVGRFGSSGSNAVAAVGATNSLTHLIINFFIGCSVGSGVTVAQAVGANNKEELEKSIHTAIPLAIIGGAALSVLGILLSRPLLELMSTPAEIIDLSDVYMKIYFSGLVFTMLYNFGAAILRAMGDTKRPLVYLTISGIINVILNIFFVTVLKLDVAGVAIATVISQIVSSILVIGRLMHNNTYCRLELKKLRFNKNSLKKILKIGIPSGIQSSLFSISNVIIQSSINSLSYISGLMAGNSAASSIEGFIYTTINSFEQTSLNFTGQNVGAKKYDRVKKIFILSIILVTLVGIVFGAVVVSIGEQLLGFYITDSADAIKMGVLRLSFICLTYFLCGIMGVTTGSLRGMGVSLIPMFLCVFGVCGIRIGWIMTVFQIPAYHTPQSLYVSFPISWTVTFIMELITFLIIYNKRKNISKKYG